MIRKRTILSLALLASTAACGGGGGGGSGSAVAPAASSGATPSQGESTDFANPQVVMSADGTITMASGQTAQTATEDENRQLTIHVNAGGVTYDHTFDKLDTASYNATGVYTTGFVGETGFAQIDNVDQTDGSKHTLVFFNDGSRLLYANFGSWMHSDKNGNVLAQGAFATGIPTPASDIPTTGGATYTGNGTANGFMNDGTALIGSPTINVKFGPSGSVDGSIPYINAATGEAGPNVQWNVPLNGAAYAGAASAQGMTGHVQGALVGPGAAETNGTLGLSGGGKSMVGSFGAAK